MKQILFAIIAFGTSLSQAQSIRWKVFNTDPYFRFELPEGFTTNSAKNQKSYISNGEHCIFTAAKFHQPGLKTSIPADIEVFYRNIQQKSIRRHAVVSDSSIMFRGLLAKRVTERINYNIDTQITATTLVLVKDDCYVFSVTYSESNQEKSLEERDHYIASIQAISGYPYGYQYTNFDESVELGRSIGRIFLYGILLFVITIVVLILFKKWSIVRILKNIAGIFLLGLAFAEIVSYNVIARLDLLYWFLLVTGGTTLIGVILLFVNVPDTTAPHRFSKYGNSIKKIFSISFLVIGLALFTLLALIIPSLLREFRLVKGTESDSLSMFVGTIIASALLISLCVSFCYVGITWLKQIKKAKPQKTLPDDLLDDDLRRNSMQ